MRRLTVLAVSIAVLLAGVLASPSSQAATQGRWVIRKLGTLGGRQSEAVAIDGRGQVVGRADRESSEPHAVLWTYKP
jgi:uncharacterized membrane protein